MLIDSSFHDFYDSILSFGIDKTVVYSRKTETVPYKFKIPNSRHHTVWPHKEEFERKGYTYKAQKYVIGFCGQVFPLVRIDKYKTKIESFYFYSQDKLSEFLEKEKIGDETVYFGDRFVARSKESMKLFFDPTVFVKLKALFQEHKTPVFIYGRFEEKESLVLHPRLKSYRFVQIKDPSAAFQEIFMFISGVLGVSEKPTVKISDKEMAKKKGHDGKYSFKQPPSKKRTKNGKAK